MDQLLVELSGTQDIANTAVWVAAGAQIFVGFVAIFAALHGSRAAWRIRDRDAEERRESLIRESQSFLLALKSEIDRLVAKANIIKQRIEEAENDLASQASGRIDNPTNPLTEQPYIDQPTLLVMSDLWVKYADFELIGDLANALIAYEWFDQAVNRVCPSTVSNIKISDAKKLKPSLNRMRESGICAMRQIECRLD